MIKFEHTEVLGWEAAIRSIPAKGYRQTKNGRYEAFVSDHSKSIFLGTYDTPEEAKEAVFNYRVDRFVSGVRDYGLNPDDGVVYEDNYVVFENGMIFNLHGERMIGSINKSGYRQGIFNGRNRDHHKIIADCFIPDIDGFRDVDHKNGDKLDICAENLERVTHSENVKRAYKTGLMKKQCGEDHHAHKLTAKDVEYIRSVYLKRDPHYGAVALSKKFGVDRTTIHDIVNGKLGGIDMLKIENVVTPSPEQWRSVIMGARNPMNSWEKSDSQFGFGTVLCNDCPNSNKNPCGQNCLDIGPNDLDLMKRLRNAGTDHRKFMRMIVVYADLTAPMYWWSEYDTYKIGTVANSTSKMHKMLAKPFEMNDFSFDKLPGWKNEVGQYIPDFDYDKEIWKEIGKTGYEVSDLGRIRRGDRILAGSYHSDGYIFMTIKGDQIPIHRFVANAFIPNPDHLPEVNHKDGNKMNNSASNLEWVTSSENSKHAHAMGLQPRGLSTYKGKFTDEQREEIKTLWNSGKHSRREIARMYGVSHTCINDILNDKYRYATKVNVFETVARPIVDTLNELRDTWIRETDETKKKQIWYAILQLLPVSYNQRRTVMLNYEVLANIYKSRKDHRLDEWREFCKWIEGLPYSEIVTGKECEV